jgi:hypothetical protein
MNKSILLSFIIVILFIGAGFLIYGGPAPAPVVKGACYIGGCSGQICSDQEGVASDCMYREEYACYKTATCERQKDGECGWTETAELSACLNSPAKVSSGLVTGHITLGPNCPVEQADKPCPPSPEAYTSREAIAYATDQVTVKARVHLTADGNYTLTLPPGQYYIQISPAGIGPGEKKSVTVKANQTATVNFDIDTGIR